MIREEKDLLLKDLSARWPYGVVCDIYNAHCTVKERLVFSAIYRFIDDMICVRPYLFPMSSMTEEQEIIYGDFVYGIVSSNPLETQKRINELYDWLNKNHFDYRGLISMGLAIDATGLNIY